ncbi:MAG: hypothetical protein KAT18_00460 [Candidatus Latescibacteria bacterium]|nr:hypothetical protein [Candidatus Latescibacterota bacterium]
MRYRLIALAVTLAGFLVINYSGNEKGQALILDPTVAGEGSGAAGGVESLKLAIQAQAQIRQALIEARAMLDTLDAIGIQTENSDDLREKNRAGLERFEQLRMSYLLSQILWRQTMINLVWAVFSTAILLPIALFLDRRLVGVGFEPIDS